MEAFGRRQFLAMASAFGLTGPARAASRPELKLHLAPAVASLLVARALDSGAFPGARVEVWRNLDVLRAGIVSGEVAVFTAPSTVPANLYNRGAPVRLVSITGMGHMSLVTTTDENIRSLADLAGRTVQLFFKNDMPDLVFRCLMARAGLAEGRDFRIEYAGSAVEVTQLLVAGKARIALLAEPNVSMTLPLGPFRRAIDIQQAWAEVTGRPPRLPVSGLAVTEAFAGAHIDLVRALHAATREALDWARDHPGEAGAVAERHLGLKAEAVAASLAHSNMAAVAARDIRPDLEFFWSALAEISPGVIGGRLPDAGLYLDV